MGPPLLADVLQRRLELAGTGTARVAAVAFAGAALTGLESAQAEWVSEDDQHSLGERLDDAMNAIAPLQG